jgi:hypothetical protein
LGYVLGYFSPIHLVTLHLSTIVKYFHQITVFCFDGEKESVLKVAGLPEQDPKQDPDTSTKLWLVSFCLARYSFTRTWFVFRDLRF